MICVICGNKGSELNHPNAAPPQPKVGAFCWPAESRPLKGRSETAPLRDLLASKHRRTALRKRFSIVNGPLCNESGQR